MLVVDCPQGSDAWWQSRAGIPTASRFSEIIKPTGGRSASWKKYAAELVAQRFGVSYEMEPTEWMLRGIELEEDARRLFEFEHGVQVHQIGFCARDDGLAGFSPDGVLGEPGADPAFWHTGLEIKNPKPATHVIYLDEQRLPTAYRPQVHGSMAIGKVDRWWFMSNCPNLPPFYTLVERDDYTEEVAAALDWFIGELEAMAQRLGAPKLTRKNQT